MHRANPEFAFLALEPICNVRGQIASNKGSVSSLSPGLKTAAKLTPSLSVRVDRGSKIR